MSLQHATPENARQAEKSGHLRYMLIGGTIGAIVALVLVSLFVEF